MHSSSSPLMPHFSWLPSHDLFVSPTNTPGLCWPVKTPCRKFVSQLPDFPWQYSISIKESPAQLDWLFDYYYSHTLHDPNTISNPGARLQDPYKNIHTIDFPLNSKYTIANLYKEREIERYKEIQTITIKYILANFKDNREIGLKSVFV